MLLKGGSAIEKLVAADTCVFDKTGTLTHGDMAVTDVVPFTPASSADHLLALTASVVFGLTLTVSTDVFFALLLGVPMACLGGVEVARSFSELVFRHRILEERMLRRQFLAERKAHLSLRHPRSMALRAKSAS